MGFEAYAPCRCIGEGIATAPPPGVDVSVDECGTTDIESSDWGQAGLIEQREAWTAAACAHPDFQLPFEGISNNVGMAALREAVLGMGELPTLTTFLPKAERRVHPVHGGPGCP